MKKVFLRRILFLLGAAVVMAGCGKPESEIEPDGEDTPIKITAIASTSDTPETRLGYQENESSMSFTWKDHADGKKESFTVVHNDSRDKFTFTQIGASGGNKGTFEGTLKASVGQELYALYPVYKGTLGTIFSIDLRLQPLLTTATDLDGNRCQYLWAKSVYRGEGVDINFNFKHMVSMLKLEMSFPAGAAAITGVKLRGVYVRGGLNVATGELSLEDQGVSTFLATTNIALTADRKLTAYIYLFPDDLSGKTLRLTATDVNDKTYAVEFSGRNVVAGKLYTLAKEMKGITSSELQIGDFYQNDGTVISRDVVLTNKQKARCTGVVLKVGRDVDGDWKDDCVYMQKDGITPMPTIRGYVLALSEQSSYSWGPMATLVGTNTESTGFYGYKNTQIIKKYAIDNKLELKTAFSPTYKAINYGEAYEDKRTAPANSSGWFLPSIGQCQYWLNNYTLISESTFEAVEGFPNYHDYFCSSSESNVGGKGTQFWSLKLWYGENTIVSVYKTAKSMTRSVLAF